MYILEIDWVMGYEKVKQVMRASRDVDMLEVAYEDLMGSQGDSWKRAMAGYLGVDVTDYSLELMGASAWKIGMYLCDDCVDNYCFSLFPSC